MEPVAYTWKHKNEDEEHRGFGKHHPGFKDGSGYVVTPLYASPAPLPVEPTAKQIDAAIDGFFGDRSFSIAELDHYRRRMRDALIAAARPKSGSGQ